jgi:hypothetical protein
MDCGEKISRWLGDKMNWKKDGRTGSVRRKRTAVTFVAIAVVAVIIAASAAGRHANQNQAQAVAQGTAYLQKLENRNIDTINQNVVSVRKKERAEAIASGKLSLWAQFDTSLFFGDSRIASFAEYDYLSEDKVMAHNGWTIHNLEKNVDQIAAKSPENLFIGVGSNDLQSNIGDGPDGYAVQYLDVLKILRSKAPNTNLYVISIMPVNDKALSESQYQVLKNVDSYNTAVQKMCKDNGITYIDTTSLCTEHADLYEPDGVHFKKDFYPLWGQMLADSMDL